MADEIKQPGNIGAVLPLNPSRGAGQRKKRRQAPEKPSAEKPRPSPDDDRPHRIDEYV